MRKCACHGLPRAANGQCIVKRRAAQARYQLTEKGRATSRRHVHTTNRWVTKRRYELRNARVRVLERLEELQQEKEELLGRT